MDVKPGSRWRSVVCDAEVLVIKPPKSAVALECGGEPLAPAAEPRGELKPIRGGLDGGALIGKRYVDDESGLELLCNKGGRGTLVANGAPLRIKDAQRLPSSD